MDKNFYFILPKNETDPYKDWNDMERERFAQKKDEDDATSEEGKECEQDADCPMGLACWGERCLDV